MSSNGALPAGVTQNMNDQEQPSIAMHGDTPLPSRATVDAPVSDLGNSFHPAQLGEHDQEGITAIPGSDHGSGEMDISSGDTPQPSGALVDVPIPEQGNSFHPAQLGEHDQENVDAIPGSDNGSEAMDTSSGSSPSDVLADDDDDDRTIIAETNGAATVVATTAVPTTDIPATDESTTTNQPAVANDERLVNPFTGQRPCYVVWRITHFSGPLGGFPASRTEVKLMIAVENQVYANRVVNDVVERRSKGTVVDDVPEPNGNAQCTLFYREARRGGIMMQYRVDKVDQHW
ncbi:MAG: hypothetical protein Q9169_000206 [Polycauliona sp. 2 TL-2023]